MILVRNRAALFALITAFLLAAPGCEQKPASDSSPSKKEPTHQQNSERPTAISEIPDDQSREGWSQRQKLYVKVVPSPNPVPFQELFELTVSVYDSPDAESPASGVELDQVRAVMPAHDHGMKVDPKITKREPGIFRIEGMRWHMKGPGEDGHWKLELVFNMGSSIETALFDYQCCRPAGQNSQQTK